MFQCVHCIYIHRFFLSSWWLNVSLFCFNWMKMQFNSLTTQGKTKKYFMYFLFCAVAFFSVCLWVDVSKDKWNWEQYYCIQYYYNYLLQNLLNCYIPFSDFYRLSVLLWLYPKKGGRGQKTCYQYCLRSPCNWFFLINNLPQCICRRQGSASSC